MAAPSIDHRFRLPRALAISWTKQGCKVKCPYSSCGDIHADSMPNFRCYPRSFDHRKGNCPTLDCRYEMLFPFCSHGLVKGIEYRFDHDQDQWITYGRTNIMAMRAEVESSSRGDEVSDTLEHLTILERNETITKEKLMFDEYCLEGKLVEAEALLGASSDRKDLVNGMRLTGGLLLPAVCRRGHIDIAKLLLDNGADVNILDKRSDSDLPIFEALNNRHFHLAYELIGQQASVLCRSRDGKQTFMNSAMAELGRLSDKSSREKRVAATGLDETYLKTMIAHCQAQIQKRDGLHFDSGHQQSDEPTTIWKSRAWHNPNQFGKYQCYIEVTRTMALKAPDNQFATLAFIPRGYGASDIVEVSGYSENRLLDKVFDTCDLVDKGLVPHEKDGKERPGSFFACHAEKKAIVCFLWDHTELKELLSARLEKIRNGAEPIQANQYAKSLMSRYLRGAPGIEKRLYVSAPCCDDCKDFLKLVEDYFGIVFKIDDTKIIGWMKDPFF